MVERSVESISNSLNNFHTKMSPPYTIDELEADPNLLKEVDKYGFGYGRWVILRIKRLDHKMEDEKHSEKFRNGTYRDFYRDIDRVVSESGLEVPDEPRIAMNNDEYGANKLYPLYERLIEMGYNHHDLVV